MTSYEKFSFKLLKAFVFVRITLNKTKLFLTFTSTFNCTFLEYFIKLPTYV